MGRVETIVVGGGISAGNPFALNAFPYIANTDPPTVVSSPIMLQVTGANQAIVISSALADPEAAATSILRVRGGIASFPNAGAQTTKHLVLGARQTLGAVLNAVQDTTVIGNDITLTLLGSGSTLVGKGLSTASGCQHNLVGYAISVGSNINSAVTVLGATVTIGNLTGGGSGSLIIIGAGVTLTGGAATTENILIGDGNTQGASIGQNSIVGCSNQLSTSIASQVVGRGNTFAAGLQIVRVLGDRNTIDHKECIILGTNITTTAANQCWIGGGGLFGDGGITTVIVGKADKSGTPQNVLYRQTDGTGADINGGNYKIQPGLGTGAGTCGQFQVAIGNVVAGAGNTLQTAYVALSLTNDTASSALQLDSVNGGTKNTIVQLYTAGTLRAIVGSVGAAGGIVTGSAVGETVIRTQTQRLLFSLDGGTTIHADFTTAGVLELNVNRGLRFNNATSSAAAAVGTLNNAPAAGDPGFWLKINIGGTNYSVPCWAG